MVSQHVIYNHHEVACYIKKKKNSSQNLLVCHNLSRVINHSVAAINSIKG